ncbi:MAG: hypothetical protein KatS3mg042_1563 [Rhodothermaceae bacterium]|nr:MAG: hypothetical protein KatS3mg042_1563 [Rhodothermaceae bacterium]
MFASDPQIVAWLRSMGYPVDRMDLDEREALFQREARQWGVRPSVLAALVRDAGLSVPEAEAVAAPVRLTWASLAA